MNILVIDDEKTILNTVYVQLKEMNLEVDKIDTANSTKQARELMKKRYYNIFLCDIVMPEEDGITFAKWVLNLYPDVKFVFLTAHADFNYMKEAIAIQSFDYLLQPASIADLKNVVERAITQIRLEDKNKEINRRSSFLMSNEEEILEKGAYRYCKGKQKDSEYLQHLIISRSSEKIEDLIYLPVLITILKTNEMNGELEQLRSSYQNIIDEILKPLDIFPVYIISDDEDEFLLLICMTKDKQTEIYAIIEKLENCRILIQKLIHLTVAIYCGEYCNFDSVQKNYRPLFKLEKDNVRKDSRVFRQQNGNFINHGAVFSFEAQVFSWNKFLDEKEFNKFYESIFYNIEQYSERNQLTMEYMIDLHQVITKLILGFMVNHGIDSTEVFDEELPYLSYMQCWQDLETFDKSIQQVVNRLYNAMNLNKGDFIEDAMNYIKNNIDRRLEVREVAQHINVHPEYLTKLFKKKTGFTVKSFIINEKMEAAKMLLVTTMLPVTVIADHVGYGNYSNFTRTFKQLFSCTPVDYRKKFSKIDN